MKEKKKPKGKKAEIRAYKKRLTLVGTAIMVVVLVVVIVFSGFLIYSYFKKPSPNTELKAAIADQLSLTVPNEAFNQTVTNILNQAGYSVDYYPGEEVNVEFYRKLPTQGYGIIILRVHSALGEEGEGPVSLFTSELYSPNRYVNEQLSNQLIKVHYWVGGEEQLYFGIFPNFVKSSMNGRFQQTVVIMMGCNGLTYTEMAEAFIEKGARVYISWDLAVSASHTDRATIQLLTYLAQNQTIGQAVENTMNEVGPDPTDNSTLVYYPIEAQNHVIPNTGSNLILKIAVAATVSKRKGVSYDNLRENHQTG